MKFYNIIKMENYEVFLPEKCHFSIGTSPYYSHQNALAIDIYQHLFLENIEAVSPVAGKVIKTKPLIAPKPRFQGGINKDFLILIKNEQDPAIVFKILHVQPKIKEGEKINVGDYLGDTIRNGYFAPWSTPHLHLEMRPFEDPSRARGGKRFSLNIDRNSFMTFNSEKTLEPIPLEIQCSCSEYLLARLPRDQYINFNPIFGVRGNMMNAHCMMDGGIPMYKNGVFLNKEGHVFKKGMSMHWGPFCIGHVKELKGEFGLYEFNPMKMFVEGIEIRGISLFFFNFEPLLKIMPFNISDGELDYFERSKVFLTIKSKTEEENFVK